jgi:ABC-type branched-subunit amino acid transport system substrate-binding protein
MILFSAFSGGAILRDDPPDRYVFNYRPSAAQETAALVNYLLRVRGFRAEQIAVVAEDHGDGAAAFIGVANVLRKQGRLPQQIVRISEERLHGAGLQELLAHTEIRAIVLAVPYPSAVTAIRHLRQARDDLVLASVSLAGSDALAKELSALGPRFVDGLIVSQVVPLPTSPLSAVVKYRQALRKYYPHERPGFGSLEGYINASLLVEGLRNAGNNLTTETLVNALERLDQIDLGLGAPLHYSAAEHQASHRIWGTVLNGAGHFQPIELE